MGNYIKISGKDDKGPWQVERIDNDTRSWERKAHRFGELCRYVIEMLEGRDSNYNLAYRSSDGLNLKIFEETEEKVLLHLIGTHNRAVNIKSQLERLI